MTIINGCLHWIFDILLFPFQAFPPVIGLCILSIVLGIAFLLLFKYTSPQKTVKKIKNKIKGSLYEVRLYKDDLGVMFKANKSLLVNNFKYIMCSFIPLIPMIVLILPILIQLDARYGIASLKEGDTVVLDVKLKNSVDFGTANVELKLPKGLAIDAGPVRSSMEKEYSYRIKVKEFGEHQINIMVNQEENPIRLDVGDTLEPERISRLKFVAAVEALPLPYSVGEMFSSDSLVDSARIGPFGRAPLMGMDGDIFPWLIIFCVVALIAGFAMKGVFNVTI